MPRSEIWSALRSEVEAITGTDRSGWSGAARSDELVEILEIQERFDAAVVALTAAWDREKCWAADGALSAASWLTHRLPMSRSDAMVLVRTSRRVSQHADTAKALEAGDISTTHAELIARAVRHRESLYPEHEDVILDAARTLDVSDFRDAMQHWQSCADAVLDHRNARDEVEGNYLELATTFGGVGHGEMRLDPISMAGFKKVLDEMEPPDPKDAPRRRSTSQRRADALMRLVTGDEPPRINLDAIADVETLAGRMPTDLTGSCCELEGVGTISSALMGVLACDCAIGRVLMRGKSEVLDLGRRTRLITPSQRRALRVRDRTCVEPGCTLPASYCDGHHVVHWTKHGASDLVNLELRCRRHHVLQHQRDLRTTLALRRE